MSLSKALWWRARSSGHHSRQLIISDLIFLYSSSVIPPFAYLEKIVIIDFYLVQLMYRIYYGIEGLLTNTVFAAAFFFYARNMNRRVELWTNMR